MNIQKYTRHFSCVLRPKHFVKNFLIFLPLIFGKKLFIFPDNFKTLLAFIIFSIAASAAYLFNDISDLEKDRLHPNKRNRPLASGKITVAHAIIIAFAFSAISIIFSFILNINFGIIVFIYLILNMLYSRILREIFIIDLCCIACFFLLRILAGGYVSGVRLSFWIVFLTIILSFFLGLIKRRQEISLLDEEAYLHRKAVAGCEMRYLDNIIIVLALAVIVSYSLYVINFHTIVIFGTKKLILTIPFVIYGIIRYLYLIYKAGTDGDPTVVLFSDINMQLTVIFWISACILLIYL